MRKPATRGAGQRADDATDGEMETTDVDVTSLADSHGEDLQMMQEPTEATHDEERNTLTNSLFNSFRDVGESSMTLRDGARGDRGEEIGPRDEGVMMIAKTLMMATLWQWCVMTPVMLGHPQYGQGHGEMTILFTR